MNREQLEALLIQDHFTDRQIEEACVLFHADADGDCGLVSLFAAFCQVLLGKQGFLSDKRVHQCAYAYIVNIENNHPEYDAFLGNLYIREAEYFTALNSGTESLYYAEKVLEMEQVPHNFHAIAIVYSLNILSNAKLYSRLLAYVEQLRRLAADETVEPVFRRILMMCLLDCYTLNHDYENYCRVLAELRNIQNGLDAGDRQRASIELHILSSAFAFEALTRSRTDEDIIAAFCCISELIKTKSRILGSYASLFLPMFDAVRPLLPLNVFVNQVLEIISVCSVKRDTIVFYEYLIRRCSLQRMDYPEIFDRYFQILRDLYEFRMEAETQSIEIALLQQTIQQKYRDAAMRDKLTGLFSRYAYHSRLESLTLSENLTVVVVDLTRLKHLNDTYGHAVGDQALITAAERLKACFSDFGKIYRCGGDEFSVIAECSEAEVRDAVERISALSSADFIPGFQLELSIGYARCQEAPGEQIDYLCKLADRRMYAAKRAYYERSGLDRRR